MLIQLGNVHQSSAHSTMIVPSHNFSLASTFSDAASSDMVACSKSTFSPVRTFPESGPDRKGLSKMFLWQNAQMFLTCILDQPLYSLQRLEWVGSFLVFVTKILPGEDNG